MEIPVKEYRREKIGYQFIGDFEYYMKVVKKLGHNSCMKYLGDFKKIIWLCIKNKWLPSDPFICYKLARKEVVANYLLMEEIDAIAQLDLKAANLQLERDVFLFSCYTGLAYADVKKLSDAEIQQGPDAHTWLFLQRPKSGTSAAIPLLPVCLDLLEKYKSLQRPSKSNTVFPVYSNQKMNQYLKEIAKLAGIKQFVSYHVARHSFASPLR